MALAKLTESQAYKIRKEAKKFGGHKTIKELSEIYGVSDYTIMSVLNGSGAYSYFNELPTVAQEPNDEISLTNVMLCAEQYLPIFLKRYVDIDTKHVRRGISTVLFIDIFCKVLASDLLKWQEGTAQQKALITETMKCAKKNPEDFRTVIKRTCLSIVDWSIDICPHQYTKKTQGICHYRQKQTSVFIYWKFKQSFLDLPIIKQLHVDIQNLLKRPGSLTQK
jgi:hypothetical protein